MPTTTSTSAVKAGLFHSIDGSDIGINGARRAIAHDGCLPVGAR
jgi:hypothetical protein